MIINKEEKFRLRINNRYFLTALLLFKYAYFGKDLEKYSEILSIVKDLDLDEFLIYFTYITNVNYLEKDEIKAILDSTVESDKMESVIEKWIEKGREGGMIFEAQDLLLDSIEAKFDKVPRDIKLLVKNTKDREKLREYHRAVIKSKSVDEIRSMF